MIGFSAAFAKTISLIVDELEETDRLYYIIFQSILSAIVEGRYDTYINIPESRYSEVIEILDYNGFSWSSVNKSLIKVEWKNI